MRRLLAAVGVPALLAGVLLAGSSGFSAKGKAVSVLNTPSDRITFSGMMVVSGNTFTITSTGCTLTDVITAAFSIGDPCKLAAGGTYDPATGATMGSVAISGPDGAITFKETTLKRSSTQGCMTGTGLETAPGPTVVPIRVEGQTFSESPAGSHIATVSGTIQVYEAGGPPIGINCRDD